MITIKAALIIFGVTFVLSALWHNWKDSKSTGRTSMKTILSKSHPVDKLYKIEAYSFKAAYKVAELIEEAGGYALVRGSAVLTKHNFTLVDSEDALKHILDVSYSVTCEDVEVFHMGYDAFYGG